MPPSDAYAAAALKNELAELERAPEGTRNHSLFTAAAALSELINSGSLDDATTRDDLTDVARRIGLDDIEIDRTIDSAIKKTAGVVRTVAERPQALTPSASPEKPATADPAGHNRTVWGEVPPVDGAEWLFDGDDSAVALWGDEQSGEILWAAGEALTIVAPPGVGKSTLAGQLMRAQLGLQSTVLGLPVIEIDKPILVLAMDRPAQIRRSMLRQFDESEREAISGRLLVRPGPPFTDMAVDPSLLVRMAEEVGAGVVYIDSLKDAAVGLSTDEVGAMYNRSRQALLASGVNLCEAHHVKKPSLDGGGGINSLYGSTWIAAGSGSVILLSGEPGDLIIRMRQVKCVANEVGPWHLLLNQEKGDFTVRRCDLLASARKAGSGGLMAEDAAKDLYETRRPTAGEKQKAERQLDKLVAKNLLTKVDGVHGPVWFLAETRIEPPALRLVENDPGELF